MASRHLSPSVGPFQTALIACALLLRLVVPNGWMPVATAQGLQFAPCPGVQSDAAMGHGMAMAAMPGHQKGHTDHQGDRPCVFAALAGAISHADLPNVDPVLAAPAVVLSSLSRLVAIGQGLAAPPPPPTGPPALF